MIGGRKYDEVDITNFTSTVSYYYDDTTWCVNQAKTIPTFLNLYFYVKDFEVILAGIFCLIGAVLCGYGLTGFQKKPYDMYSLLIVAIAIVICSSHCFQPEGFILCFGLACCSIVSLFLVSTFNAFLLVIFTHPILREQVATISALIDNNFELAGNPHILQKIMQQEMVRHFLHPYIKFSTVVILML